jgi:quaternary ammonium compound-resistance protein SugE
MDASVSLIGTAIRARSLLQCVTDLQTRLTSIDNTGSRRSRFPRLSLSSNLTRPSRLANQQNGNVIMAWTLLSLAGFLEIGFAFGMKWSAGFTRLIPGLFTAATGLSSIFLLSLSLRTLPVGTGYAVWTGIGAAGTAVLGMAVLGDSTSPLRIVCIGLILAGVIGLKLVSES